MRVSVIADLVTFRVHTLNQVGPAFRESALDEKCYFDAVFLQSIEQLSGIFSWSVIEGDGDSAGSRQTDRLCRCLRFRVRRLGFRGLRPGRFGFCFYNCRGRGGFWRYFRNVKRRQGTCCRLGSFTGGGCLTWRRARGLTLWTSAGCARGRFPCHGRGWNGLCYGATAGRDCQGDGTHKRQCDRDHEENCQTP